MYAWKNILSWLAFLLLLVVLIFFAEDIYKNQRCKKVDIQFETKEKGYFITKENINDLLTENGNKPVTGTKFILLNFDKLESNILKNKLVKNCQISRTLGSNLVVNISQKIPIARITALSGSSDTFSGLYLGQDGGLFPLSNNYTQRVVLLSGKYLIGKRNLKAKEDKNIIEFVSQIIDNPFWNANITQIIIDEDQNINFLTLIGDYLVEYGIPQKEAFERKMKKLKVFYKQIEPENREKYKMISIKYANQVVGQLNPKLLDIN